MNTKGNILLTGATGFIGHHLVEAAIKNGYTVHALVRASANAAAIRSLGAKIHYADITDLASVSKALHAFATWNIAMDYVIHAAALTKAPSEKEFINVNCGGTHNLLSALSASGLQPKKIIFISSLAACGPELAGKIIHADRRQPITLYGKSKLQAEAIIKTNSKWPYILLRPTAVYGPGEKDLLTVFKIVSKGLKPKLGFNTQELTFIYVKDLVAFILNALHSAEKNKTYFVTDGVIYDKSALNTAIAGALHKTGLSITLPLPLVKTLAYASQYTASLLNKQSALNAEKYKELTAQSWNCDVRDTFNDLNYVPHYTLQQGVNETTQWYKQHKWI